MRYLDRSGRVLVGRGKSRRSTRVLVMFNLGAMAIRHDFFSSSDNPSTVVTPYGIFVSLLCKQSWRFVGDLDCIQQRLRSIVPTGSTILSRI